MKSIEFDLETLSPWADVHRLLSNARSLKINGRFGKAKLVDRAENGNLELVVETKPGRPRTVEAD